MKTVLYTCRRCHQECRVEPKNVPANGVCWVCRERAKKILKGEP